MFTDSHAHLEVPQFENEREDVIERAWEAGVRHLLAIGSGTGPHELKAAFPFAEKYDWIYATVGIHPHEAALAEEKHFTSLAELCRGEKVLAVGEIGLDYHYDHSPKPVQKDVLLRQLELASKTGLPVIFHCREAWGDLREIVLDQWRGNERGGILHCFTGTREDAYAFLDRGFYISFAGNVTFKKSDDLREVAREVPLDRILIETDSPYLAPVPYRGKRNEPAYVREVARVVGEVRGLSAEEIGVKTTENFFRLFRLSGDPRRG